MGKSKKNVHFAVVMLSNKPMRVVITTSALFAISILIFLLFAKRHTELENLLVCPDGYLPRLNIDNCQQECVKYFPIKIPPNPLTPNL